MRTANLQQSAVSAKVYRIKKCDSCGARNTVTNPQDVNAPAALTCSKCGEHPGIISSYGGCVHNPVHAWDEKITCEKLRIAEEAKTRKRRKEVFPTDEIPHLWFHAWKTQESARNAHGNLFFRGPSIFSYGSHFEIARHAETKRGSAVLLNTATYSVTTTRQQSAVRQAIPDSVSVFQVCRLDVGDSKSWRFSGDTHAVNIKDYDARIESALLKAIRARSSWRKESEHGTAVTLRAERNAYASFFGLRIKPLAAIPALDSKKIEAIKAKESERVRLESEKTKREKAERLERAKEAIANWRTGVGDSYGLPYDAPTMLRISGDEVQTSKGARVPATHAKRALTLVRAVVARGEDWQTNGHTCHVGHYAIERISADGTIKAGCHVIPRNEWEAIAPALDPLKASESPEVSQ